MSTVSRHPDLKGILDTWRAQELLASASARIDQHRKGNLSIRVTRPDGSPAPDGILVNIRQKTHAFGFGCAALSLHSHTEPAAEAQYQKLFTDAFNFATIMTFWHDIEKEKGKRNTELYLRRAKTLKTAGIRVKGHPLILPGVCPGWVPKDADGGRDAVKDWITYMVRTFRGVVDTWDVTGDIWTADNQKNGIGAWVRKVGRQQVFSDALRWTLSANPNAVTLYNDFALDNAYVDLVRGAVRGGDPLHVQGLEAHMDGAGWLLEQLWMHSDTFGKLGRPLHWSEITVNSNDLGAKGPQSDVSTRSGEARQAEYADAMYRLLFSHPNVDAICWWNLVDGDWGGNPGGLVRRNLTPKPSYDVIRQLIHEEWNSTMTKRTDHRGEVAARVFAGDYEITVDGAGGSVQHVAVLVTAGKATRRVDVTL